MNHLKHAAIPALIISALSTSAVADTTLVPVVVTATRQTQRVDELLADVSIIDREQLDQAGPSTITDILARQPGIEIVSNGGPGTVSDVHIRGANGNHTVVLIDGQRVGSVSLGTLNWSRLPASEIERIEILRGPASSLYGSDAIGGVVQIFTRRGEGKPTVRAEAGFGSKGTSATSAGVSGSSGSVRYNLGLSTYATDGISSVVNPANSAYNPDKDGFTNNAKSGSLSWTIAPGQEVGINFLQSKGRNRYDSGYPSAASDYKNISSIESTGLYLKNGITDKWTSTLRVGRSEDDSKDYVDNSLSSIFRTHQEQLSWQNDVRLPLGTALFAAERLEQRVSGTSTFTVQSRRIDSLLTGWGANIDAHRFQVNLRRDNNSQFGDKNTGNLAYGYRLDPAWTVHGAMGTAFKAPTFDDLYFPLAYGYVGNPNLRPEFARNREVAVDYRRNGQVASATYYVNRIQDLISWSGVTSPVNIGQVRIQGLTLAYSAAIGNLDVSTSLDLQDPRNEETGHILARRAKQHGVISVGQHEGAWDWRAELSATGTRYDTEYSRTNTNPARLGGYSLINLYGAYQLSPEWSAFARVDNLLDHKYQLAADFGTWGTTLFAGIRYQMK